MQTVLNRNCQTLPPLSFLLKSLTERARAVGLCRKTWFRRAGISEATFYRWASGTNTPRYDLLCRLSKTVEEAERKALVRE